VVDSVNWQHQATFAAVLLSLAAAVYSTVITPGSALHADTGKCLSNIHNRAMIKEGLPGDWAAHNACSDVIILILFFTVISSKMMNRCI
jgi:hypothetical protein